MGKNSMLGKNAWFSGFLAFSVVALGGLGYFMSKNIALNYKSGASNVQASVQGILVKKGSGGFTYPVINGDGRTGSTTNYVPCGGMPKSNSPYGMQAAYNYVIVTDGQKPVPNPREAPQAQAKICVPVVANASQADPLVGKNVLATGSFKDSIFYATSLKLQK